MFLHNLKYEFLQNIRQKELIGWMMLFPIILATLFYVAFGNIYEKEKVFSEIDIAVVEVTKDDIFNTVLDELSTGDESLFSVMYTDRENAEKLLRDGDVLSIIYVDKEMTMSAASKGLAPSIVRSFLEQYTNQKTIITETAKTNPDKLDAVIKSLSNEINCMNTKQLSNGNMDPYITYFYNLIAMVALFGSTNGVFSATRNQGNLSAIGARKCVSPTHKLKTTIASLLAAAAAQIVCVFISITYIVFILRIDMGDKIAMIYLSGVTGTFAGTSLGFFIGSIGRISESTKYGIAFPVTMISCFLSGLMIADMKSIISQHCPVVNKLNPAALISDLFYCLSIYDDYSRYISVTATLLIMTVLFTAGGFLLTRRKKYASI